CSARAVRSLRESPRLGPTPGWLADDPDGPFFVLRGRVNGCDSVGAFFNTGRGLSPNRRTRLFGWRNEAGVSSALHQECQRGSGDRAAGHGPELVSGARLPFAACKRRTGGQGRREGRMTVENRVIGAIEEQVWIDGLADPTQRAVRAVLDRAPA